MTCVHAERTTAGSGSKKLNTKKVKVEKHHKSTSVRTIHRVGEESTQ